MQQIQSWAESSVDWGLSKLSQLEEWLAHDVIMGGWVPSQIGDLSGKVALVTGGNSGLGFNAARKLAENGAHVYIVSRDIKNGHQAAEQIRSEIGKQARVDVLGCDMFSLDNVVTLAREFRQKSSKLDILILNAGVFHPGPFMLTKDRLEQTLQINYYAHMLLTFQLLDTLRHTHGSRVIFQSSPAETFGKLQWDNLTGEKYRDSGMTPYGTSKLYGMMAMKELSVRVPEVDFICVQPGLVMTPLQHKISLRYLTADIIAAAATFVGQTPYHGAYSTMFAATEPSLTGKHWAYYGPNSFNMWPITAREPANKPISNPVSCWKLLEDTKDILNARVKGDNLQVPHHPDPANHPLRQGARDPHAINPAPEAQQVASRA